MTEAQSTAVVGIATHNRAGLLRKAIASALAQSHASLRVSVIDDASSDETPDLRESFGMVSWERWEMVRGHIQVRNHIMLTADEDYYVSLDDDAWFLRGDEIEMAVHYLDRHPKVAAIAFDILSPDRPDAVVRAEPRPVAMFIGCGHVLRLSIVKELGGYSASHGIYGAEEKELCLRLIDAGYDILKFDGLHVWHDKTAQARDLQHQHRSGVCNDLTIVLRRVPLAILIPVLVWKLVSHMTFAFRHRLVWPCLLGIADFVKAAGSSWRGRCPVRIVSLARFRKLSKAA
jgi:glycosyltransferase involved in cell wall biosynthesis